ncbi:MAG: flagellar hook-length control protein FliK [Desulfitobacteriaceae bacterium]|nr:flagellar hook-length control protein FliK [Desulfitobacteriaceae bacterium]MDI6879192.1 flagellar hook-length control protein FliK [Desulfitobacteriaceae bacterium]MDI6914961.1 flagellar hook-length control protein FliK [Desulfitobacteriaceae bacterium]
MVNMNVLSVMSSPSVPGDKTSVAGSGQGDSGQAAETFTAIMGDWLAMLGLGGQNSGENVPGVSGNDEKKPETKTETKDIQGSLMAAILAFSGLQPLGMDVAGAVRSDFPAGKEANSGKVSWEVKGAGSARIAEAILGGWSLGSGTGTDGLAQIVAGAERAGMIPLRQGGNPALISELDNDRIQTLLKELSGQIMAKTGVAPEGQQTSDGTLLARNILTQLGEQNATQQNLVGTAGSEVLKHQMEGQPSLARDSQNSANGLNEIDSPSLSGERAVFLTKNGEVTGSATDGASLNPEAKLGAKPVAEGLLVSGSHKTGAEAQAASYQESDSMKNGLAQEGQGHSPQAIESALVGTKANDFVAGKADSPSIWQQMAASLQEHMGPRTDVSWKRPLVKELEIQLHPAELGKIQIALRWDDGTVHLQVQASERGTGTILQNHLSDLRQSLQDAGVACGMLQMGLNGERRQRSYPELFPEVPKRQEDESVAALHYPQELDPAQSWVSSGMNGQRLNITA